MSAPHRDRASVASPGAAAATGPDAAPRPAPAWLRRAVLAVLLALAAWSGWGLVREVEVAAVRRRVAGRATLPPRAWQPGTILPDSLHGLAAAVDRRVPPGEPIAFVATYANPDDAFFAWLWTIYFLPGRTVWAADAASARALARYWIVYPGRLPADDANGVQVLARGGGSLYRSAVAPPAETEKRPLRRTRGVVDDEEDEDAPAAATPSTLAGTTPARGVGAFALLVATFAVAGAAAALLARRRDAPAATAAVVALLAGSLAAHAALVVASLAGIAWSGGLVAAILAGLAFAGVALAVVVARAVPAPERRAGETASSAVLPRATAAAIAAAAVGALAVVGWRLWATLPDFVYHIGLKAERFALVRGVDWSWLASPAVRHTHPDYPTLTSVVLALQTRVAGGWHEPSLLLWSILAFAGILVAADATLAAARTPPWVRCAAVAALALSSAMVATGHRMVGAMDWLPPLATAVAAPALLGLGGGAWTVAIAAAFAAATKIEGIPLAAFLVAAYLVASWWRTRRIAWRELPVLVAPLAVVLVLWYVPVARHGLYQSDNGGPLDWDRWSLILPAVRQVMAMPAWHGLGWAALAVPLALALPRGRVLAAVATLQLAFYFWVYLTAPVGTTFYVLSSLPRLLYHVWVPGVMAVALAAAPRRPVSPRAPTS